MHIPRCPPLRGSFGRLKLLCMVSPGCPSGRRADALGMAEFSLRKMAAGGMHDHVGGGFHRYSVDEFWHVPHFEKVRGQHSLLHCQQTALCFLMPLCLAIAVGWPGLYAMVCMTMFLDDDGSILGAMEALPT